jgi:heterodisulfide reductase subunit A
MAVARSRHLEPLYTEGQSLFHSALVIGGGVAGMTAALNLAGQGYEVTLVERQDELGGHARTLSRGGDGGDVSAFLHDLIARVSADPRIEVLVGHEVVKSEGFVGNFRTTLACPRAERRVSGSAPIQRLVEHGVTLVATGGQEYHGPAFGLDTDPRVVTQGDLERMLAASAPVGNLAAIRSVVMLQCVGPWDEARPDQDADRPDFYCSRICCSVAAKNALRLKERNPDAQVYVLYNRDIRTYGFQETLYTRAREAGVLFLRYPEGEAPRVSTYGKLKVTIRDEILGQSLALQPDMLVLSAAVLPALGSRELAELLKFSCTLEGFFLEAHVKLQPVEFPAEGIFLAGSAHYPKLVDEAIAQAGAAAARAASILSHDLLQVGGIVARVDPAKCTGCLTCVRICPFGAVRIDPALAGVGGILGAAEITPAACRGCGLCPAECPARAIQLQHFTDDQVLAKEEALFAALDRALAPVGDEAPTSTGSDR